jgi:hypothetical protein
MLVGRGAPASGIIVFGVLVAVGVCRGQVNEFGPVVDGLQDVDELASLTHDEIRCRPELAEPE